MPEYLTVDEVAAKCRVSIWTVYAYAKAGLPHGRFGNRMLFDAAEVHAWIREHHRGRVAAETQTAGAGG